ncbi:MAG: hypothetical protein ISS82_01540 [Nanoarchaeota archaeon]|nr:hypothetical protein [Nanoarchaeota archaeon]
MKKNILTVEGILTEQEIEEYHSQWHSFKDKYKPLNPYEVHSNKQVIGKIFQFKDYPIFRSHVFNRNNRLRSIDPYGLARHYLHPFWHITHYSIVGEQIYHASMTKIRKHEDFAVMEILDDLKELREPIFWRDKISVELIYQLSSESSRKKVERCHITFYNDLNNNIKGRFSARTLVNFRKWVRILNNLKYGNKKYLDLLIKQIEVQYNHLQRLIHPRQNLQITKEELIERLRKGELPEEELYDFFSLWDKVY